MCEGHELAQEAALHAEIPQLLLSLLEEASAEARAVSLYTMGSLCSMPPPAKADSKGGGGGGGGGRSGGGGEAGGASPAASSSMAGAFDAGVELGVEGEEAAGSGEADEAAHDWRLQLASAATVAVADGSSVVRAQLCRLLVFIARRHRRRCAAACQQLLWLRAQSSAEGEGGVPPGPLGSLTGSMFGTAADPKQLAEMLEAQAAADEATARAVAGRGGGGTAAPGTLRSTLQAWDSETGPSATGGPARPPSNPDTSQELGGRDNLLRQRLNSDDLQGALISGELVTPVGAPKQPLDVSDPSPSAGGAAAATAAGSSASGSLPPNLSSEIVSHSLIIKQAAALESKLSDAALSHSSAHSATLLLRGAASRGLTPPVFARNRGLTPPELSLREGSADRRTPPSPLLPPSLPPAAAGGVGGVPLSPSQAAQVHEASGRAALACAELDRAVRAIASDGGREAGAAAVKLCVCLVLLSRDPVPRIARRAQQLLHSLVPSEAAAAAEASRRASTEGAGSGGKGGKGALPSSRSADKLGGSAEAKVVAASLPVQGGLAAGGGLFAPRARAAGHNASPAIAPAEPSGGKMPPWLNLSLLGGGRGDSGGGTSVGSSAPGTPVPGSILVPPRIPEEKLGGADAASSLPPAAKPPAPGGSVLSAAPNRTPSTERREPPSPSSSLCADLYLWATHQLARRFPTMDARGEIVADRGSTSHGAHAHGPTDAPLNSFTAQWLAGAAAGPNGRSGEPALERHRGGSRPWSLLSHASEKEIAREIKCEEQVAVLDGGSARCSAIAIHPDEPLLIAASAREELQVWNYKSKVRLNAFGNGNPAGSRCTAALLVGETNASPMLAVGSTDGCVRVWHGWGTTGTQQLVSAWQAVERPPDPTSPNLAPLTVSRAALRSPALSGRDSKGDAGAAGADGSGSRAPIALAHQPQLGLICASGGGSPAVRLWDMLAERCALQIHAGLPEGGSVTALAADCCSSLLYAAGSDGIVRALDPRAASGASVVAAYQGSTSAPLMHLSLQAHSTPWLAAGSSLGEVTPRYSRDHAALLASRRGALRTAGTRLIGDHLGPTPLPSRPRRSGHAALGGLPEGWPLGPHPPRAGAAARHRLAQPVHQAVRRLRPQE